MEMMHPNDMHVETDHVLFRTLCYELVSENVKTDVNTYSLLIGRLTTYKTQSNIEIDLPKKI